MKLSEVLKEHSEWGGRIVHSEDGTITLNHPDKGVVILEPDPVPEQPMTVEDRLDLIEGAVISIRDNKIVANPPKSGLLPRVWNFLFARRRCNG